MFFDYSGIMGNGKNDKKELKKKKFSSFSSVEKFKVLRIKRSLNFTSVHHFSRVVFLQPTTMFFQKTPPENLTYHQLQIAIRDY